MHLYEGNISPRLFLNFYSKSRRGRENSNRLHFSRDSVVFLQFSSFFIGFREFSTKILQTVLILIIFSPKTLKYPLLPSSFEVSSPKEREMQTTNGEHHRQQQQPPYFTAGQFDPNLIAFAQHALLGYPAPLKNAFPQG